MTSAVSPQSTPAQRWLARLTFVLVAAAIVILMLFAGLRSLAMLAVGGAAAVVSLVAAFFFLSRRGIGRWLSLAVFVLAPIAVIVVFAFRGVLWVAIVVGRGMAAREHNRTRGAGQGSRRTGACPSIRRSRLPGIRT